jgi:hypothetical protein
MSDVSGFDGFADFDRDPTASIASEFGRLAIQNDWKKGSKKYRKQRAELIEYEFGVHFGSNLHSLEDWQALCKAVGITNIPSSITQCKKVRQRKVGRADGNLLPRLTCFSPQLLKGKHVNIFDLVDAARSGTAARTFPTSQQLADYTMDNDKIFPKKAAKSNKLLKFMLRHLF